MDSSKIIEILNNDPEARGFMEIAKRAAIRTGVTPEEWEKAKEVLLPMAILKSKAAFKELSNQVWSELQHA